MRKKLEKRFEHIISKIDRYSNTHKIYNYKFIEKIVNEIRNFEDLEKSAFFMKLFSEKHDDEIVSLIIDYFTKIGGLNLKYNYEICKEYGGKNFLQLAIENNYSSETIVKLYNMNNFFYIDTQDENGFTFLHTLVNSNVLTKWQIYKNISHNHFSILEYIKDNNGETYIDLAKRIIDETENIDDSNLSKSERMDKSIHKLKNYDLKNIICDYNYRNFIKFLDMLTDDIEINKKLIIDNFSFYGEKHYLLFDSEKYSLSKMLFWCIDSIDTFYLDKLKDINLVFYIEKLLETGYPKINEKKDNLDFISYAIEKGFNLKVVYEILDVLTELEIKIPDWLYENIFYMPFKSNDDVFGETDEMWNLYNFISNRGFNLLNFDIDIELFEMAYCLKYNDGYTSSFGKMIIEVYNAKVLRDINDSLTNFNCKELITNCRDFSGQRLLKYDIDEVGAEKIALKIIENRKDAIYVSDEITKEEVISAIEECKLILDKIHKSQDSVDFIDLNTTAKIKKIENKLTYFKKG